MKKRAQQNIILMGINKTWRKGNNHPEDKQSISQGGDEKWKSSYDDEHGQGQEKRRPSTYVEGNNEDMLNTNMFILDCFVYVYVHVFHALRFFIVIFIYFYS